MKAVVGTGFSRADPPRILKIDLTDGAAVQKLIDEVNPSVIVNRYQFSVT